MTDTRLAWVEDGVVRDVAQGGPADLFHPDVAAHYDTAVPPGTRSGARLIEGVWTNPPPASGAPSAPIERRLRVSRPEFKQLLTSAERIAIRQARAYAGSDPTQQQLKTALDDLWDILDDPALTYVDLALPTTIEGVQMLAQAGLIAPERVDEILAGWPE